MGADPSDPRAADPAAARRVRRRCQYARRDPTPRWRDGAREAGQGWPASGADRRGDGHPPVADPAPVADRPASDPAGYFRGCGKAGNNRSRVRHYRAEVETLEPAVGLTEPCLLQARQVNLRGVEQHDILDGAALLGDLQVAEAIGPLEGVMHLLQTLLLLIIGQRSEEHTSEL